MSFVSHQTTYFSYRAALLTNTILLISAPIEMKNPCLKQNKAVQHEWIFCLEMAHMNEGHFKGLPVPIHFWFWHGSPDCESSLLMSSNSATFRTLGTAAFFDAVWDLDGCFCVGKHSWSVASAERSFWWKNLS